MVLYTKYVVFWPCTDSSHLLCHCNTGCLFLPVKQRGWNSVFVYSFKIVQFLVSWQIDLVGAHYNKKIQYHQLFSSSMKQSLKDGSYLMDVAKADSAFIYQIACSHDEFIALKVCHCMYCFDHYVYSFLLPHKLLEPKQNLKWCNLPVELLSFWEKQILHILSAINQQHFWGNELPRRKRSI